MAAASIHAMVLLAQEPENRKSTTALASALKLSPNTLAKAMQRLSRAGLVNASTGPNGGFSLARAAADIPLLAIYEAVDGKVEAPECLLKERACDGKSCALGDLLHPVHEQIHTYLSETTLSALSARFTPPVGGGVCGEGI
jgi:Rrf2 family protein